MLLKSLKYTIVVNIILVLMRTRIVYLKKQKKFIKIKETRASWDYCNGDCKECIEVGWSHMYTPNIKGER